MSVLEYHCSKQIDLSGLFFCVEESRSISSLSCVNRNGLEVCYVTLDLKVLPIFFTLFSGCLSRALRASLFSVHRYLKGCIVQDSPLPRAVGSSRAAHEKRELEMCWFCKKCLFTNIQVVQWGTS